ncbi:MAG: 16S rRNA (adenine(1518)-N(6)/adenine(1519)-N(6))-dimethyltransferase [Bacteroidetes bacterium 4572_77]|nr:MAG: 16S rRNA (adenine(1518)-N(6)/adenine(1519)-N(6))-dimethyltransferase [Bacteroidetes bacterium 4572_77]
MNHQVKPKKRLGQHFLNDLSIASQIVDALSAETKHLLEIGPGTGVLTDFILQKPITDFKIVEIDKESVDFLNHKYPELKDQLVLGDFLKMNLSDIFPKQYSIVGNFPYNISSQILFRVWDERQSVAEVVGMFQKEVAERVAAGPGSKTYGILSVLLRAYYDIEYLFTVPETVFTPPPKVKSGVIRLRRNKVKELACDEKFFKSVVKTAFGQRRKTISNSLKSLGFKNYKEELQHLETKRPEQLDVDAFVEITQVLSRELS